MSFQGIHLSCIAAYYLPSAHVEYASSVFSQRQHIEEFNTFDVLFMYTKADSLLNKIIFSTQFLALALTRTLKEIYKVFY